MIQVIKDIEPNFEFKGYDVVLLGCSIYCMIEGGFGAKLKHKYPVVEEADDSTPYADLRKLGKRITIPSTNPIISLLYICKYPIRDKCTLDYNALGNCLETANAEFKGKKVLSCLLGSSRFDGNGDKDKCLDIIKEKCIDFDLDIYDYYQLSMGEEKKKLKESLKGTDDFKLFLENSEIFYEKSLLVPKR